MRVLEAVWTAGTIAGAINLIKGFRAKNVISAKKTPTVGLEPTTTWLRAKRSTD